MSERWTLSDYEWLFTEEKGSETRPATTEEIQAAIVAIEKLAPPTNNLRATEPASSIHIKELNVVDDLSKFKISKTIDELTEQWHASTAKRDPEGRIIQEDWTFARKGDIYGAFTYTHLIDPQIPLTHQQKSDSYDFQREYGLNVGSAKACEKITDQLRRTSLKRNALRKPTP